MNAVEKHFVNKKITKRQRDALIRHSSHHSSQHIQMMLDLMSKGATFSAAHKKAQQQVGS